MDAKRDFLVVYDYGMNTASELETNDYYNQIAAARTFDIDDSPTGWLLSLRR